MRTTRGKVRGNRYVLTHAGTKSEWKMTVKRSGIADLKFHDIRRTVATKAFRLTGNLEISRIILGHTDIATTAKYYAHMNKTDVTSTLEAVAESHKKSHGKAVKVA